MTILDQVVIMGGGCYGSFYLEQLAKARRAGAVAWKSLLIVDTDPECRCGELVQGVEGAELVTSEWGEFLADWLVAEHRTDSDRLVPSPFMPHLMAAWLEDRARTLWPSHDVGLTPAESPVGTPFDQLNPNDGVRYLSHADWLCPVHCIEPARCPVIKAPRQWEMIDTIEDWAEGRRGNTPTAGPVLFTCRHLTHGVGMYPVINIFAALDEFRMVVDQHGHGELIIGSISACHGALAILRVERR